MGKKVLVHNIVLLAVAIAITVFSILTGAYVNQGYDIEVDSISPKRFTATREVINEIATQRIIDEAILKIGEKHRLDPTISDKVIIELDSVFTEILELRRIKNPIIFIPFEEDIIQNEDIAESSISIPMSSDKLEFITEIDDIEYVQIKNDVFNIMETLLQNGIYENADATKYSLLVMDELSKYNLENEMQSLYQTIIFGVMRPNYVIDYEAIEKAKEDVIASIEPIKYLKDQNIVNEGDPISEEIYAVLDTLGFINKGFIDNYFPIIGSIVMVLIIFALCLTYMFLYHENVVKNRKLTTLLFTLLILIVVVSKFLISVPYQFIPVLVFTLLVAIFLEVRLAIVLNLGITLICALIIGGGIEFIMLNFISGTIVSMFSRRITERNKIIIVGLTASLVNALAFVGITFLIQKSYSTAILDGVIYSLANGAFSVIITVGSLSVWEVVFGVITPIKLLDLTNPNEVLLRRLAIEVPGTYHHSLIVANLAETAAYDIGANSILARVGGYYHDIGKLKEPLYFSENQTGENLHDFIEPMVSVKIIKGHVEYGIELADQYRLPKVIKDILSQHHGNTLVKYFYYKVKKANPDKEIDEMEFRYNHSIPQTREAAIVMIADTVEAAVRSMIPSGKSKEEVENFVATLIKDKLDDGQLDDSGLSIKDLITIRKSFMRVFRGMYHERISYPK